MAPLRLLRPALAIAFGFIGLGLALSSCSTSTASPPATHGKSTTVSQRWCELISPSLIHSITGFSVDAPTVTVKGSATQCHYGSGTSAHSIVIGYNGSASAATFTSLLNEYAAKHLDLGKIDSLGDQAFYSRTTSGSTTVVSVVALTGSTLIQVSTPAPLSAALAVAHDSVAKTITSNPTTTTTHS
jgi:hypothetical protein